MEKGRAIFLLLTNEKNFVCEGQEAMARQEEAMTREEEVRAKTKEANRIIGPPVEARYFGAIFDSPPFATWFFFFFVIVVGLIFSRP